MHLLLFLLFSNYHQKLNKMQYHKHFWIQKYGKFANDNLEKFVFGVWPWPREGLS